MDRNYIIFLDVDGVLNTYESRKRCGIAILDENLIQELVRVVHEVPGTRIVMSSTWRLYNEYRKAVTDSLAKYNAYENIYLGETPNLRKPRHFEIRAWLCNFNGKIDKFVILDDNEDAYYNDLPNECFFLTNDDTGLTEDIADKIIAYFKG